QFLGLVALGDIGVEGDAAVMDRRAAGKRYLAADGDELRQAPAAPGHDEAEGDQDSQPGTTVSGTGHEAPPSSIAAYGSESVSPPGGVARAGYVGSGIASWMNRPDPPASAKSTPPLWRLRKEYRVGHRPILPDVSLPRSGSGITLPVLGGI